MFPAESGCPADDRCGRAALRGESGKDGLRLVVRRAEQDAAGGLGIEGEHFPGIGEVQGKVGGRLHVAEVALSR